MYLLILVLINTVQYHSTINVHVHVHAFVPLVVQDWKLFVSLEEYYGFVTSIEGRYVQLV